MKLLDVTVNGTQIHVENYPDAERVVRISGDAVQRLCDLGLHRDDLAFARECLDALTRLDTQAADVEVIRSALYRSAIVHLFKCFGKNASRSSLRSDEIYTAEGQVALDVFAHFKIIRNKHLVHDENSYTQSHPGAIINPESHSQKVAAVICMNYAVDLIDQSSFNNLYSLVSTALEWVHKAYDDLERELRAELEARSRAELVALPTLVIPKLSDGAFARPRTR
ncbi:MAG: hypothetical protein ACPHN2_10635 [Sinimarinibacterium flocculans]|uniref:hypothetical protein n=1 Tax=Sinimarinibacterium flocculans TaxID=985250 RepID=UPI003C5E1759